MGEMKIVFSDLMNTNYTFQNFTNTTYIDIYITPISDDHHYVERNINLTWEAISFINETLTIQLNFTNALDISRLEVFDNITFEIIN